jgi:Suppressor of fused protein (SUFU)
MSRNTEEYFSKIDALAGEQGRYFQITDKGESPVVAVASYNDLPENGHTTSFSYGLSSIPRAEWNHSRPELIISVKSSDNAWALCMGELIREHSRDVLFSYGSILNFQQTISAESAMTAFLVFACTLLDEADLTLVLPDRIVHFSQLYPIYESEIPMISQMGVEKFFWDMGIDFYDVHRLPLGDSQKSI